MNRLKFMQRYALENEGDVLPTGDSDDQVEPLADLSTVNTEISNASDELVALEARLTDLAYLADSIGTAGGMSQRFAMEAEKLLHGFGGVPTQYYTKEPSATRLKVALEEIEHGIAALIALAVAAVLTIIYKIFKWFKGTGDSASSEEAVESVKAMSGADERVKKAISSDAPVLSAAKATFEKIPGGIKVGEKIVHNFNDAVRAMLVADGREDDVSKFLDGNDPFLHDFVTQGALFKAVMELGRVSGGFSDRIKKQNELLENIIVGDKNQTADLATVSRQLDDFKRNSTFTFQGKEKTLREIQAEVSGLFNNLENTTVSGKVSLDELNEKCKQAVGHIGYQHVIDSLVHGLSILGEVEKASERVSVKIPSAAKDGDSSGNSKELGSHIREAFFSLKADVFAFGMIIANMKQYAGKLMYFMEQRRTFVYLVLKEMRKHFHELSKNKMQGTMPVEYETLMNQFDTELKNWETENLKRAKGLK